MKQRLFWAAALIALGGHAHADADLDALRAEMRQLKQAYDARLTELEARLQHAEARAATPPAAVREAAPANAFNPEMSLILSGQYAHRDDLDERVLTGFMPIGGHDHDGGRGFSLNHTELIFSANVDPHWRGLANIALKDDEVEVEEAWFQSLGLGNGLTFKGGRFLSGIGYLNAQHPHAWDFTDAPLMYRALFGENYTQDGVQLKWLAPTETFVELGLEAGAGGTRGERNGAGALAAFAHAGGDVGTSNSWRAGVSYLHDRFDAREGHWEDLGASEVETLFDGRSKVWLADAVWKWAPDGNPSARNLTLQGEWFRRAETGDLTCLDGLCGGGSTDAYRTRQSGWYAQAAYQFMPRWRLGLRHDRLDSGRQDFGAVNGGLLDVPDHDPRRTSLMLDWSPSEFSRLRLQYALDKSMAGIEEDQWTLQYVMSLGSHGAHRF